MVMKYSRENIICESVPGQNGINVECMCKYVLVHVVPVCLVLEAMLLHIINFAFYRKRGLFENQNVSVLPEKGTFWGQNQWKRVFFHIENEDMSYIKNSLDMSSEFLPICMYGSGGTGRSTCNDAAEKNPVMLGDFVYICMYV